ncbi:hypothetical protein [Candidatus Neptunichlamydia sp. REUL1]|uniref:hypothetical protein n=1 Tax=Candidatus Neptunichlamydia sp. REUL1 TaxID=3064277 RepID=UPI002930D56F|nr:hypothetical protein [Candidatus Neptunochlamydia sp. REUL1]
MRRKTIILISCVVFVHLFFFLFDFKEKHSPPPPKKSIVVNTYVPPPTKATPAVSEPRTQQTTNVAPKKSTPSKKNEILKDLKETLSRIEAQAPPETSLSLPKQIQSLQIDHADKKEETDYFISLAHALKEELELPELGEVKLELTVSHTGQVLKLRILQALSEKNRRYLELNLPRLRLPPFSEDLKNENAHTFTLTFCNAT